MNSTSRDERQQICVNKWLKSRGVGALIQPTGCGKTTTAFKCIKKVLSLYPSFKILVVVPTTNLKEQWEEKLPKWEVNSNVDVIVVNTAITKPLNYDMLVIDEIHVMAATSFSKIFSCVNYKLILGLTATLERIDGKHKLIEKYCPVVDEITLIEAMANHWLADYVEYQVLLDVDNIDEYRAINKSFTASLEFFGFDFNLVLKLSGKNGFEEKKKYTSQMCKDPSRWAEYFKAVNYHAVNCMRKNADKKNFIYNHSKKLEIAQLIIANRPESKIITFSNNIRMASAIGGPVYSSKETKKKGRITLAEFEKLDKGVINTAKKLVAGADIPLVNCEIILGQDSSKTRAVQTRGRALRKEGDKTSEIFNIVINDTQETKWFNSSHEGSPYITIDEENLIKVLNGEPFNTYKKPISKFNFRF